MPKLCEQLTWLNDLHEQRGINTDEDKRYIAFIRRKLMALDQMKEKVDDLQKMISGNGA